jgi:predicted lipoprotein with Yx(FWY)xxD motif
MKKLFYSGTGLAVPLLLFTFGTFTSCNKTHDAAPAPAKEIKLAHSSTLGSYLTDKDNHALYFFSNDFNGQNNCTGGCAPVWPVYNYDNLEADDLGDSLSLADFGTITTSTNAKQLTYKGWPLYYYAPVVGGANVREGPGTTTGDNVGGVWFVAKPDYTIMLLNNQLIGNDGKSYKSDYTEGTGKTIYFTDAMGRTLYAFKNDKANKNTFTKSDFSNNPTWPIYETDKVMVASAVNKSLFSTTDVFGKKQLTFNGWPLYYFGQDASTRGATKGVSIGSTPGTWPVATKDRIAATP